MPRKQSLAQKKNAAARKAEAPHKGVTIISPRPHQGRPYWALRWKPDGYQSLPFIPVDDRPAAVAAASAKAVELGLVALPEAQKHLAEIKNLERTLQGELRLYIAQGIKQGPRLGQPHAEPTIRNLHKGVAALTKFAASQGIALDKNGELFLLDIKRTYGHGLSLLSHWQLHEKAKTGNVGSVMTLTKVVHAVLSNVRVSETQRMFDPAFLSAAIPVRPVAPAKAARVQITNDLRAILHAAMELDTPTELVSADVAMLLLTGFRRAEQAFLRVRHCSINQPIENHLVTWIGLPAKLDDYPTYNHAKGGYYRNVLMTRVTPLGAELLQVLCEGRQGNEWVTSLDYSQLSNRIDRIVKKVGFEFSSKSLRATAANHCQRVIGKDRAVLRCGHTEDVADQSYTDKDFANEVFIEPPASLEVSMGIGPELREIIARVRLHNRAWGEAKRPLPRVLTRGSAAQSTGAMPIAV